MIVNCYNCKKEFKKPNYEIKKYPRHFCSNKCLGIFKSLEKTKLVSCANCGTQLRRQISSLKKSKSGGFYCNHSCAATYSNLHKTTGNRKSKLECWLESQLTSLYPNLEIHFNKKNTIGSELDIYIPSLNLAFELNGIFHYEPIHGENKLNQIQTNDKIKKCICAALNIKLIIIDVSKYNFSTKTATKYLDFIKNLIK